VVAAASLSAGTGAAGLLGETTEILVIMATAAQPAPTPAPTPADAKDKRRQAGDLLRRARQAMAEDDLAAAESLISAAEDLGVHYGLLHVGDTPKRARRDLQRKLSAADNSPDRRSQLFSSSASKNNPPRTDPFAARSGNFSASRLAAGSRPAAELRVIDGTSSEPGIGTGLPGRPEIASRPRIGMTGTAGPLGSSEPSRLQFPFAIAAGTAPPDVNLTRLPSTLAGTGATDSTVQSKLTRAGEGSLLLHARRALATGEVRQATKLVDQAKRLQLNYAPLDDTPQKVEAAIRRYEEVAAEPNQTEAQRRRKVRMLMGQVEMLLEYGDYDRAEQLAVRASREKINYGLFEARPQDLMRRIAAARRRDNPSATPPTPEVPVAGSAKVAGPSLAAKEKAAALVREARTALEAGQLARAETLTRHAEQLQVPDSAYMRGEDRPGTVLLDIRKASLRDQSGVAGTSRQLVSPATGPFPVDPAASRALYDPSNDPTRNVRASHQEPALPGLPGQLGLAQMPTLFPAEPIGPPPSPSSTADPNAQDGPSLVALGEAALSEHNTQAAYEYFRQAAAHIDELDPVTRQRLQERLQLLSVPRTNAGSQRLPESAVDKAAAQQQALARQIYADVAHQAAKAHAMLQTDADGAVSLLEETRQAIEVAGLEPAVRDQLLRHVDRHLADVQQFIERNRGRIELEKKNERTRDEIERAQRLKLEIQENLALMVDDYNRMMDEQRYAEAEVVAKRAAELAPEEPIVQQLLHESRIIRRHANNLALQVAKEQGFLDALFSVDESGIPFDDRNPYQHGDSKTWAELSNFRSRLLRDQGRPRSERELQIEQKLKTPVSLAFTDKPLAEVLDYLADVAAVNMVLDPQGLAEEGITSSTPVTIEIRRDIMLKSALNLILEPLHLSYVIKDEVLKITSEQLRDGEVYIVSYNVADLVVPIPNFIPGDAGLQAAYHKALGDVGFGGGGLAAPPLSVMASQDGSRSSAAINPAVLAQISTAGQPAAGMGGMRTRFGPGGLGGGSQADFDSLIDLITATIEPTSWDAVGGPGSIAPFETNLSLVISQTQEVHEQIVDLLEQLRRMQDLQVTIEVRFITLNDNFFERMGVDFDFDIDDNIDRPFQVFGREDPSVSTAYTTTFTPNTGPARDVLDRDHKTESLTVGMATADLFSADMDIPFRQGSFGLAVPQFGGFAADAGAQIGFAILSDIEAFFFINAAQGDRRSNVLQAPKVTLFNGQQAYISDTSQSPFVVSVIPVVGDFAAAQQPVIVVLSEGTFMTVQAVVSNDRRFVRLTVVPFFSKIGEVNTFQFTGSETTTTSTSAEGIQTDPNNLTKNANASTVTTSGTTVQLPTFSYVQVTTTVSVPDGGTVLLGGIKRLSEGRNEFGVPILNKIPYLNRLFKNVGIGRETQSLMMMVTPRIIIQEEEEEAQTGYTP
jgi:general secretion pathway protein D